MIDLYLNALALVMPSYFGPTNIYDFQIRYTRFIFCLDGLRDQVGDAGLL